jgi:ribosomal protein S18 acetylase RimI-like enzyme
MADMLVRLYALPEPAAASARAERAGVRIRRALHQEREGLVAFVRATFGEGWVAECRAAFDRQPIACFVAVRGDTIRGFACHDVTRRNFFGPAGVAPNDRGQGTGAALTLAALAAMRDAGYAYAIIGGVGPADFYARVAGAVPIEGSTPGIYAPVAARDGR